MPIPESWRNVASGVKFIRKDDKISVKVEGGWISVRAPVDGVIIECGTGHDATSIFLPNLKIEGIGESSVVVGGRNGALDETVLEEQEQCGIEGCSSVSSEVEFVGTICMPCWAFASGVKGGDDSQARRNALAAAKRRV